MLDRNMNYVLGDQVISLDGTSQEICYVSHAHSDHSAALRSKKKKIIASEETIALCGRKVNTVNIPGIELLRSGHMLGSTQLRTEEDGGVFVYTGDFKLEDGLTIKGAEVPEADYLLIEGTFGSPEMVFPKKEDVWEDISEWTKEKIEKGIVIFGAYVRGKSQEIISLMNKYAGITPFVHYQVSKVSKVYNRFGAKLDFISLEDKQENLNGNFVAIMPPQYISGELVEGLQTAYGKRVYTALATGWAMKGWGSTDKVFPLSDHADFKEIIEYVERSGPRRIFCCHGNERSLSRILKEKGYDAVSVRDLRHEFPQTTLTDVSTNYK